MTPYSVRELLALSTLTLLGLLKFSYMTVYGYRQQLRKRP